jgi:hypothetical protein
MQLTNRGAVFFDPEQLYLLDEDQELSVCLEDLSNQIYVRGSKSSTTDYVCALISSG